ncbi:MAG TPA: hypothetical protein VKM72_31050 [Thermoanaerobaculia bacterium]|nr:hypothetical protein [Thermoanaerobaculia bacterium]
MRTAGRLLLLFSLAWAALWATPACFAEQEGPPVRLVSPRAGATLVVGTTAELEWAPLALFPDLSEVEEWEAFLSLDGGATYPVRITPHLDQDLRRVRWQVPDLPTADASILLRFGDEQRETAVELPSRFSIAASPVLPDALLPLARQVAAPGEPALPGRAGVVAWVEGSRRGGSLRQVVAMEASGGMRTGFRTKNLPLPCAWISPARRWEASPPVSSPSSATGRS